MVLRRWMAIPLLATALTVAAVSPALSGERHRHHRPSSSGVVHSGLPSIVPGLGTYSGAISALRVRGNGLYFSVDGGGDRIRRPARLAPAAKIIPVSLKAGNAACAYESGVCVIRP